MDLQVYGPDHIASFLLNDALLVRDLADVAAHWPDLDEEERGHHRAELLQTWGNRLTLLRIPDLLLTHNALPQKGVADG